MSLRLGRNTFGDPANAGNILSHDEALALLNSWVLNPRLQWHMKQVAHLMQAWAREKEGADEATQYRWYLAGLLHDADWDQWPEQHCRKIIEELEHREVDPEVIHAIASHGPNHFGVEPSSRMGEMLYVFDELSGLIHAYSLMRPTGYEGMNVKGVKKRLKEKYFAAGVSREEIVDAMERASLQIDDVIHFVLQHQKE